MAKSLLRMPVHSDLAAVLVGFRARFTFAQVQEDIATAAAGSAYSVPALHIWIKAYRQHGLARPPDMPALVEALCCGDDLTEDVLGPDGWYASEDPTPAPRNEVLPQQLQDVLVLAVVMLRRPSCDTFDENLVKFDGHNCHFLNGPEESPLDSFAELMESSAARQISAHALHSLLKVAQKVGSQHENSMGMLLGLPAALQLSSASVAELLQAHVRHFSLSVWHLLALPAAQEIDTDTLVTMLQTAVAFGNTGMAATPAHTTWQLAGEQHEDDASASSSNSSGNGSAVLVGLLASGLPAASAAGVLLHASSRACFS
uniref:Uncharacterized protein n=1 Tax=Tetradesmus obliquus TaxID=3088 RepID=A0A383W712_TETOB|eukprot:jgi/Sobl393_1/10299/SZX64915.1